MVNSRGVCFESTLLKYCVYFGQWLQGYEKYCLLSLKLWLTIFWITKSIDWGMECYLALSKHRWLRMAKGYINTVSLSLAKVSLLRVLDTDATRLRYCWKFNKRLRAKDVHSRLFQHVSISKNKQTQHRFLVSLLTTLKVAGKGLGQFFVTTHPHVPPHPPLHPLSCPPGAGTAPARASSRGAIWH